MQGEKGELRGIHGSPINFGYQTPNLTYDVGAHLNTAVNVSMACVMYAESLTI